MLALSIVDLFRLSNLVSFGMWLRCWADYAQASSVTISLRGRLQHHNDQAGHIQYDASGQVEDQAAAEEGIATNISNRASLAAVSSTAPVEASAPAVVASWAARQDLEQQRERSGEISLVAATLDQAEQCLPKQYFVNLRRCNIYWDSWLAFPSGFVFLYSPIAFSSILPPATYSYPAFFPLNFWGNYLSPGPPQHPLLAAVVVLPCHPSSYKHSFH